MGDKLPTGKRTIHNTKYVKKNGSEYALTSEGIKIVRENAELGCSLSDLSLLLGVTAQTLGRWRDQDHSQYNPEFAQAYGDGEFLFKRNLRERQMNLAEVNASMSIHLGKHYLDQNDRPVEHHHLHRVVGTLPDYDASTADWQKKFAPDVLQGNLLEQQVEDAEIIETGEDRTDIDRGDD